jgi:hypothetical protein
MTSVIVRVSHGMGAREETAYTNTSALLGISLLCPMGLQIADELSDIIVHVFSIEVCCCYASLVHQWFFSTISLANAAKSRFSSTFSQRLG